MTETTRPTILLPEEHDPTVAAFRDAHIDTDIGVNLRFDTMSLDDAADALNRGEVDAVIAGATHPTKDVFVTAIHKIGTENGFASSFFIMEKPGEEPIIFADCAINHKPTPDQLVKIAEQTTDSARRLGMEPVVAFLSLSTNGSAGHLDGVKEVVLAAKEFKAGHPEVPTYGEVQFDAAWVESIHKKKTGEGFGLGRPNVFIFPDGQTGNIAYKIAEQLGGYDALGPLFQGFKHNGMHDLSRGVTPQALAKIVTTVAKLIRQPAER